MSGERAVSKRSVGSSPKSVAQYYSEAAFHFEKQHGEGSVEAAAARAKATYAGSTCVLS
jgi:hypothetical protein